MHRDSFEQVVEDNIGLAYAQLIKMNLRQDSEAESEALYTLYKAATMYDNSKKTKFSTYATVAIRNALNNYLIKKRNYTDRYMTVAEIERYDTVESKQNLYEALHSQHNKLTDGTPKKIIEDWLADFEVDRKVLANRYNVTVHYVYKVIRKFRKELKEWMKDGR